MNLTIVTGDHKRHLYFADLLVKNGFTFDWFIEERESALPEPDFQFNREIKKLFNLHFEKRDMSEKLFFVKNPGKLAKKKINNIIKIKKNLCAKNLKQFKKDCLITYGCGIIKNNILELFSAYKFNIHAGLSPRYRGAATHFWPTYLMEPEYTGVTFHELTEEIDAGNIFHQTSIHINKNDGIHENACKSMIQFFDDLPKLLTFIFNSKEKLNGIKQKTKGRLWTEKMWNPLTLKIIYEIFDDKINKFCLENKNLNKVKLYSVFK